MQSATAKANEYLQNRVMSASPEELRMMLLDGAVKFARQGRDGLASKNYEACFTGFTRCRAILMELVQTMKPEHDRALCERMTALYMYMVTRLLESSHEKDVAKADEVIKLLEFDRETWAMLMQKIASERGALKSVASASAASVGQGPTPEGGSISFSG